MSDVMTPDQLKAIRKAFGVDQVTFALELGYAGNNNTMKTMIKRFESGKRPIPLNVARYIWLLDQWRMLKHGDKAPRGGKTFPRWPEWPGYEIETPEQV